MSGESAGLNGAATSGAFPGWAQELTSGGTQAQGVTALKDDRKEGSRTGSEKGWFAPVPEEGRAAFAEALRSIKPAEPGAQTPPVGKGLEDLKFQTAAPGREVQPLSLAADPAVEQGTVLPMPEEGVGLGADRQPVSGGIEASHRTGASPPLPEPVAPPRVLDQVIGQLGQAREAKSLTIRLHPEELGQVKLELTVEHDRLKAHLTAQNTQVQEVLERHLPRLRDALEQQGIKIDSLEVGADGGQRGEGGFHFSREHHQPATPARFAGTVQGFSQGDPAGAPRQASGGGGLSLRI